MHLDSSSALDGSSAWLSSSLLSSALPSVPGKRERRREGERQRESEREREREREPGSYRPPPLREAPAPRCCCCCAPPAPPGPPGPPARSSPHGCSAARRHILIRGRRKNRRRAFLSTARPLPCAVPTRPIRGRPLHEVVVHVFICRLVSLVAPVGSDLSQDTSITISLCGGTKQLFSPACRQPTERSGRELLCCAGMVPPVCGRVQVAGPRRRRSYSEGTRACRMQRPAADAPSRRTDVSGGVCSEHSAGLPVGEPVSALANRRGAVHALQWTAVGRRYSRATIPQPSSSRAEVSSP